MVHNVTLRLLLILKIVNGFSAKIADVETAFLWGDLEEEIFMDCPKGLEGAKDRDSLVLTKSIYGLLQAAQQYHKKAVQILSKISFEGGDVDPCLYVCKSEKGIVFIAIYIYDNLLVGNEEAIDEVIKLSQREGFSLKLKLIWKIIFMQCSFFKIRKRSMARTVTSNSKLKSKVWELN